MPNLLDIAITKETRDAARLRQLDLGRQRTLVKQGYDAGIVTSLPSTNLVVGVSTCTFKVATGVYWKLLYSGEATFPWAKIGGPAFRASAAAGGITGTSTSTAELTMPLAMEARVQYGVSLAQQTGTNVQTQITLSLLANASIVDSTAFISSAQFVGAPLHGQFQTTIAATKKFTMEWSANNSGIWGVTIAYLEVDPARVG